MYLDLVWPCENMSLWLCMRHLEFETMSLCIWVWDYVIVYETMSLFLWFGLLYQYVHNSCQNSHLFHSGEPFFLHRFFAFLARFTTVPARYTGQTHLHCVFWIQIRIHLVSDWFPTEPARQTGTRPRRLGSVGPDKKPCPHGIESETARALLFTCMLYAQIPTWHMCPLILVSVNFSFLRLGQLAELSTTSVVIKFDA
jgi:hypothetical protein